MPFEFATAGRIVFGAGTAAQVGPIAARLGARALVVTGTNPHRAEPLARTLHEHGVATNIYSVDGEPSTKTVAAGAEMARMKACDLVIGIGGGSAIDTAKAVAALLANGGDPLEYLEVVGQGRALSKPSLPCIAIPTTAGTGSEVTRNAVLSVPGHAVKVSMRSPHMLPAVAIVDPELTLTMPPDVTASTGLDALTQLIEAFVSPRSNPLVDGLCREGIARAARSLLRAFTQPDDIAARTDMALASLFGGLALANAGLGAVHGFAGPLGGMLGAPHGTLCASLLPAVLEVNTRALARRSPDSPALPRYGEAARILTGLPRATAKTGVRYICDLCDQLRIPHLAQLGLVPEQWDEAAAKAAKASSMKANPIELNTKELRMILAIASEGGDD